MVRPVATLILLFCAFHLAAAQSQISGSENYGLGGSSVMGLPRAGSLFLNPALVARIHDGEIFLSNQHLSTFSSLSAAQFVPFVGTFAAGVANEADKSWYSIGYGRLLTRCSALGGALNLVHGGGDAVTISLGGAMHLLETSTPNSGLHTGFSLVNFSPMPFSPLLSLNLGCGYWIKPDLLKLQTSWQLLDGNGALLIGTGVIVHPQVSVYAGTYSFKQASVGASFRSQFLTADLSVGHLGVTFSINFKFTRDAGALRDEQYDLGEKAYQESRFEEARSYYVNALEYDEYHPPASMRLAHINDTRDSIEAACLEKGRSLENDGKYPDAIRSYSHILEIIPHHSEAEKRIQKIREDLHGRIERLVMTGDSLKDKGKYERARSVYTDALQIDPGNQALSSRVDGIDTLVRGQIQSHSDRGKSLLNKAQLDESRKEYEQVLLYDPKNVDAKSNLESIKQLQTTKELVDRGKSAFDQAKYFDAIVIFSAALRRNQNDANAKTYFNRTREILLPQVEEYFKQGLQYYVKEDYQSALGIWEKVLLIKPDHSATLEYSKRAKEKLEALEQLK